MCGRYFIEMDDKELEDIVAALGDNRGEQSDSQMLRTGEIFPGAAVPVITPENTRLMAWGYPSLFDNRRHINVRSETAASKRTFSGAMAVRRCLVPASGYYEWKTLRDKSKERYSFRLPDHRLMLMAGIYSPEGRFAILTREAAPTLSEIHNRMPVIIPRNLSDIWLRISYDVMREAVTDLRFTPAL